MDTAPTPPHALRDGNRLQRAYYRWALPHYERIGRDDPALREQVEELDQLLYSRQGLALWLGLLCAVAGTVFGLHSANVPLGRAVFLALLIWICVGFIGVGAWMGPLTQGSGRRKLRRFMLTLVVGIPVGGLFGFFVGHVSRRGRLDTALFLERLQEHLPRLSVALGGTVLGLLLLALAVTWMSRQVQARRLARAELLAERDAARAAAAEAELRLLHVQIHPHFVFNTLATLQHWVDKHDERAGPLLRELTGFLRRSTEMLGRPQVPLAEEAQSVAHYLAILQARHGERLRFALTIEPRTAVQLLPPGLLLTLVENAVEHGLEPKIGGGTVHVSSACDGNGWWLRVDDDGLGLSPNAQDSVGLSNLRQRLRQHFAGKARFTLTSRPEGGTRAEIQFEDLPCAS